MPAIRPPDEWPVLIAGPMVRRVTRARAHIFLCTSVAASATVTVYAGRVSSASPGAPLAQSASTPLVRLGAKLWVGLVAVDLPSGVAAGATLGYDVTVTSGGTDRRLDALGLLGRAAGTRDADLRTARYPLGYAVGMLPSFVVPPGDPAQLRIVHGSCRKPHGGGQ